MPITKNNIGVSPPPPGEKYTQYINIIYYNKRLKVIFGQFYEAKTEI